MAPTSLPFPAKLVRMKENFELSPVVPIQHSTGSKPGARGSFCATPDVFFRRPQTHTCSLLLLELAHTPCAQGKKIKALLKLRSPLWHPALNQARLNRLLFVFIELLMDRPSCSIPVEQNNSRHQLDEDCFKCCQTYHVQTTLQHLWGAA